MGLIKEADNTVDWLSKYGFRYKTNPVAGGNPGYQRGYYHANDLEFLWINICLTDRKVYLYNEYDCGGLIWERDLDIPEDVEGEELIDWLDKELELCMECME